MRYALICTRFCPAPWFPFCMAWYREIPRNLNFLEKNIKKHAAILDLLHDRTLSFTEVCV